MSTVMRLGHGRYGIADPVVRELSRERNDMLEALRNTASREKQKTLPSLKSKE